MSLPRLTAKLWRNSVACPLAATWRFAQDIPGGVRPRAFAKRAGVSWSFPRSDSNVSILDMNSGVNDEATEGSCVSVVKLCARRSTDETVPTINVTIQAIQ